MKTSLKVKLKQIFINEQMNDPNLRKIINSEASTIRGLIKKVSM